MKFVSTKKKSYPPQSLEIQEKTRDKEENLNKCDSVVKLVI